MTFIIMNWFVYVGRRTLVHSGTNLWAEEIAKILEHEFDPQGIKVLLSLKRNHMTGQKTNHHKPWAQCP